MRKWCRPQFSKYKLKHQISNIYISYLHFYTFYIFILSIFIYSFYILYIFHIHVFYMYFCIFPYSYKFIFSYSHSCIFSYFHTVFVFYIFYFDFSIICLSDYVLLYIWLNGCVLSCVNVCIVCFCACIFSYLLRWVSNERQEGGGEGAYSMARIWSHGLECTA